MTWFLLAPLSFAFTCLAIILSPVLPFFLKADGYFPKWLSWFGTDDNDADGDRGWRTDLPLGSWKRRCLWLIKNPAYNFDIDVCGAKLTILPQVKVWGNPAIKNHNAAVAGTYLCTVDGYWGIKAVIRTIPGYCAQFEYGWKLQPLAQGHQITGRPQLVGAFLFPRLTAFTP